MVVDNFPKYIIFVIGIKNLFFNSEKMLYKLLLCGVSMELDQIPDFTDKLCKAKELHLDGKLDKAIAEYTSLLNRNATAELYCLLGWAYCLNGNFIDAINQCRFAIELDPEWGNAYNDLACYLIYEKRFDAALPWLEKAIQLESYTEKHLPYYNLGRVYEKKGMWLYSKNCYEFSVSLAPDYKKAHKGLNRIYAYLN